MRRQPPCPPEPDGGGSPLLLTVLCVPMFLVLLDVLAMNVAQPALGSAFGVPRGEWSLLVDAYTVPLAVGLLPAGWFVDRLGPRRVLIPGLALFAAASGIGAAGWSWDAVIAARATQGLAAAAMLPAGLAALTTVWAEAASRARALGVWAGVSAAATAVGPGVGGLLVAALDWRAVFWVNVPLAVAALAGVIRLLPAGPPALERGRPGRLRPLITSVLAAAVMTSGANGTLQVVTVHLQDELHLGSGFAGAVLLLATVPFVLLGPASGQTGHTLRPPHRRRLRPAPRRARAPHARPPLRCAGPRPRPARDRRRPGPDHRGDRRRDDGGLARPSRHGRRPQQCAPPARHQRRCGRRGRLHAARHGRPVAGADGTDGRTLVDRRRGPRPRGIRSAPWPPAAASRRPRKAVPARREGGGGQWDPTPAPAPLIRAPAPPNSGGSGARTG